MDLLLSRIYDPYAEETCWLWWLHMSTNPQCHCVSESTKVIQLKLEATLLKSHRLCYQQAYLSRTLHVGSPRVSFTVDGVASLPYRDGASRSSLGMSQEIQLLINHNWSFISDP